MMKSRIGKRSKHLGNNLTLHPAFRIMARFDERVEGWSGAMQSAYSSDFESQGIQLNSIFVPGGILVAALPGIASQHIARAKQAPHLAIFGVNLHDQAGGRVRRGFGREPFVTYRMSNEDRARIPQALRIAGDTFFAAGAKEIYLPMLGLEGLDVDAFNALDLTSLPVRGLECTSQHPLGTCRMGISPDHSVVDPWGQTWDVQDLFVADGSVIPTSLGVNPQLTIMTMATRIGHYLRELPFAH
jgi:choline dehydrogenase-like flavoprotein